MKNMESYFVLGSFFIILIQGKLIEGSIDYDAPVEIKLYHTIDSSLNPEWIENGIITLQNINTGNVVISPPSLQANFLKKIEESKEKDLLYRMKSVVKTSKGKEITFYSFLKMKYFIDGGFALSIIASLDQNGSVIGIKAYPDYQKTKLSSNASISFKAVEQGPIPDTASYILKLEREREAKERGATQDNRSFLAKYWMYIVPVVLFAVLSGTTGEAASGGPAGR